MKTIRDAVHGDMSFDANELAVIDTPVTQRLRGIKQLGSSALVYPSATHTRFEHSLGACWLTRRLLTVLAAQGRDIPAELQEAARLAALLHDVTHVPFGHTFEDERRLFPRHDQDPDRLDFFLDHPALASALSPTRRDRVRAVLVGGDAIPNYVRSLVTGTVCADLLDYLRRDAYFCGLRLDYDERVLSLFDVVDDRLIVRLHKNNAFRRDALSELVHLLQIRYSLTERVYYHHAKVIAGAMISRALELAMEAGLVAKEDLRQLRDDSFLALLSRVSADAGIADLMTDLERRRLYQRVYLLALQSVHCPGIGEGERDQLVHDYHDHAGRRRQLERSIAQEFALPESHVIVYCPSGSMALKEADVLVETSTGEVRPLSDLAHPDVDALSQKHRGLWRFYVCLRRDDAERIGAEVGKRCQALIGFPNQLEPQHRGRLHFPA